MTYAPADLKAIQAYCHDRTGQPWASLGIAGDPAHNADGGYHVGHDVLHALDTAPEDPGSDYSYTESQRDRNGLTDAASAFDLGGEFGRFREITLGIVAACRRGDPRTRDIREVIYTPDGRTVRRWDALGIRSSGDDSHLFHTHISFFRDSEGRRDRADNFGGLLRELFDGHSTESGGDMPLSDDDITRIWSYKIGGSANHREAHYGLSDVRDMVVTGRSSYDGQAYGVPVTLKQMTADLAAVKASESASLAAVQALTQTINRLASGTGGNLDAAPIVAAIQAAADKESATVTALTARIAELEEKLIAAARAQADALARE